MTPCRTAALLLPLCLLALPARAADPAPLTLAERAACTAALERERAAWRAEWAASQGLVPAPADEDALARVAAQRAGDEARRSAALASAGTPVTASALQAELERIAHDTLMPDRLQRLFAVLGDDARLAAECLARPLVAERELRALHAAQKADVSFEEWWSAEAAHAAPRIDEPAGAYVLPATKAAPASMTWETMPSAVEGRSYHTAVWTGAEMIVWGGMSASGPSGSGAVFDPVLSVWAILPPALGARVGHTATWTGSRMIVWGGSNWAGSAWADGAAYDPVACAWTMLPPAPISGRGYHVAGFAGGKLVVWGGWNDNGGSRVDGATYDPATSTWSPIPPNGAVPLDEVASAVVAGTLHAWGGRDLAWNVINRGARWLNGSWQSYPEPLPAPQAGAVGAVLSIGGSPHFVAWGGREVQQSLIDAGAVFDAAGRWVQSLTMNGGPSARVEHTAVAAGDRLLVWGGRGRYGYLGDGAAWDPQDDTWAPLPPPAFLAPRAGHTAVWTGRAMIVWGGVERAAPYANGSALILCETAPQVTSPPAVEDVSACTAGLRVTWPKDPQSWGCATLAGTSYQVLRDGVPVEGLPYGTTEYVDRGAGAGPHEYRVAYRNTCGLTSLSPAVSATDLVAEPVGYQLSMVTASDDSGCGAGVMVSWGPDPYDGWGDHGAGTRTYRLQRDDANGGLQLELPYGTTYYRDTDCRGLCEYRVHYVSGCGQTSTTAPMPVVDTVDFTPCPDVDGALQVTRSGPLVTVRWSAPYCADFNRFVLEGTPQHGPAATWYEMVSGSVTQVNDLVASPWKAYRVITIDNCGNRSR